MEPDAEHYCPFCLDVSGFDPVPCPDGHGPDCPELACRLCGTVILLGLLPVHEPAHPGATRRRPAA